MQRINTAYFYKLAQQLMPLRGISVGQKMYFEAYPALHGAEEELEFFLSNSLVPPVTSYGSGNNLLVAIRKLTSESYEENRTVQWGEPGEITEALNRFEISLQSDFGSRDTFIVSPKAAYSTTLLAERGESVLSDKAHELVPSLKNDIHDGCRCVAFELPTSAAFHFFRGVEAMAKDYGEFVRNKPFTDREKKGGLGGYANLLKELSLKVDPRITNAIEQIAGLHRNPTMHPGMHISQTEIMATLGMVVSVIETLALDWNRRLTTPEVSLVDILPDDSKVLALLEDGKESQSNGI